jgi:hypothetical protein
MGGEGIQYISIIMGRGVIKFPKNLNFQKISKFQKFYRISKKKNLIFFKNFKKFQNVHKISKLTYFIRLKKNKKKNSKFS